MQKAKKYFIFCISFFLIITQIIVRSSSDHLAAFGNWDTINETYPTILFTKRMILNCLSDIFHIHSNIPMIDYTLGMGEDVLGILNWFGFGDPFYLLFVFFDDKYTPYVYTLILYLKFLLGGMSFILMCSKISPGKNDLAYVVGALIYTFSGFTLYCHWFIPFAHAMYCIPLLIYGAEVNMQENKKGILLLSTFLFSLSGYFYLYIGSIGLAVYILYKMSQQEMFSLKKCFVTIRNLLLEYILGIGLASIFFIPTLYSFFTSNRIGLSSSGLSLFSKELFINLFKNIFVPQYNNSLQILSLVAIGVICVLVFFLSDSSRKEKANLLILLFLTTMPIVNCIMSGFGATYDRWVILILLYISFLGIQTWDELLYLKPMQIISLTLLLIILLYIGKRGKENELIDNRRYYISFVAYTIIWLTLILTNIFVKHAKYAFINKLCNILLFIVCIYSIHISWEENYLDMPIECAQPRNVVDELIENDNDFYRIDNAITYLNPGTYPNIAFLQNYNGIADYSSTPNFYLTQALSAWNVSPQITGKLVYRGLDNRGILETLCGVKYFVFPTNESVHIPYGFEYECTTNDGTWSLYKNSEFLPIIYGYRSVIKNVENIDGYSIQALMSQAAYVDSSYNGIIETNNSLNPIHKFISSTPLVNNDVCSNEEISFELTLLPTCENYILISHTTNNNQFELYSEDKLIAKANSSFEYNNNGYIGINLGTVDEKTNKSFTLKLLNNDQIIINKIDYNYTNYHNVIEDLRLNLSDLQVETNHISANLTLNEPRMICLAMPYSPGWTARVDGKAVQTHCINNMFIGIELTEGKHNIVFSYCTPTLKIALLISLGSFIGTIIFFLCQNKRIIHKK